MCRLVRSGTKGCQHSNAADAQRAHPKPPASLRIRARLRGSCAAQMRQCLDRLSPAAAPPRETSDSRIGVDLPEARAWDKTGVSPTGGLRHLQGSEWFDTFLATRVWNVMAEAEARRGRGQALWDATS